MTLYSHATVFSFSLHVQYDYVQYLTCIIKKLLDFVRPKGCMQKSRLMVANEWMDPKLMIAGRL